MTSWYLKSTSTYQIGMILIAICQMEKSSSTNRYAVADAQSDSTEPKA